MRTAFSLVDGDVLAHFQRHLVDHKQQDVDSNVVGNRQLHPITHAFYDSCIHQQSKCDGLNNVVVERELDGHQL